MRRQISVTERVVARFARADEIVVADLQRRQHLLELRRVPVRQLGGRDAELGGRLLHLEAVRIHARDEEHGMAVSRLKRASASVATAS